MSGIINSAGSKSHVIDGIDSSFQTYCNVPIASTTLGTAGGASMTPIALTNQASTNLLPKTSDFTVSDSDETITIQNGGVYYYCLLVYIANDGASRDNYLVGTVANDAVPGATGTAFSAGVFVNPGTSNSGTTNYLSVGFSGVGTFADDDRIKFFGRGVYATQFIAVNATYNQSTVQLIKID